MTISGPEELAALPDDRLPALAARLRAQLIDTVTATGGHLGAALGMVELTIAIHRVFRSPHDAVVFDTGHQTYPHKLITGRAAAFGTLRQAGGVSGYPSRAESPHDRVENSHASVGLAWADGVAKAFELRGEHDRSVVAVIGDGALTGGVAWEGLNNIGAARRPIVVVLNDNGRSYDPTAGALATHLDRLRRRDRVGENLFETLGFTYVGPVDGHDIPAACAALRDAAGLRRPVLVHAVTAKGRGYPPAEADEADRMHACGVIDPATGRPRKPPAPTWTDVFERELAELARERAEVVALTAAMRLPTGLGTLSRQAPHRVFDSGIAEQHALASAAGLASAGMHPVVAVYSTFLNRAVDQLLFDIALHELPVTLVLDRAGITGPDGPSHHGMWDLALSTCVPRLRIACPRDPDRLRELLRESVAHAGPTLLRYPKSTAGRDIPALARMDGMDILHRSRHLPLDVLLVAVGPMAAPCLAAADLLTERGIGVTVVDPRWVWPLAPALLALAARHRLAVSAEDGIADNGIGAHLITAAARTGTPARVHALGLPTAFIPHASRDHILSDHGLTGDGIAAACLDRLPAAARSLDPGDLVEESELPAS
ncbi:1-deoxy-D-xylulose-5-phosphate synthase [Nocardia terpenica]|uniref:1-deoxy-D-xylulose-5-phosphate synthase n=1 Tax=Nocardia terpenica TaxID=455432 RepID=UPI001894F4EA|nr:1-deoxy-D-xylulose-5-phosphate synthase [Nocardia terpenica]MBF6059973.1 1-deoxy-D-xylulose-5-phosphate synthase [Nocardia terpenica]MBF6102486.1 1-deoxy-D-xylulose-5-phosphate synthase [Nocardia terpenica]MBF6111323.1 1-deoxy-D-xylulose-5-phosphate synthase [Nocardia terpenica]MBF6117454.1 1-deoxy-D-xylulose-5-phosphate synthase [Nocardia terpenica]MBF6150705.1 1-deoxy-D-xylulose-5-phosphate synthase [Nocardia terpenica]